MTSPVHMAHSLPSAPPSKEALALLRILVVAGEGGSAGGLLQNLRQWADDGRLTIDTAPDLPRAVRQLAGQRWDVVLAVLGEHPGEELVRALERVRSVAGETAVPLPVVRPHAVGPYALVGQSAAMLDVYKLLARVAGSSATVLIQGESGTGKEVVARAIHMNGPHA